MHLNHLFCPVQQGQIDGFCIILYGITLCQFKESTELNSMLLPVTVLVDPPWSTCRGRHIIWPLSSICKCTKYLNDSIMWFFIYIVLGAQGRVITGDKVPVTGHIFLNRDIWMCKMKEHSFICRSFALVWKQHIRNQQNVEDQFVCIEGQLTWAAQKRNQYGPT